MEPFYEDHEAITYNIKAKDKDIELAFFKGILDISFEYNNYNDIDSNVVYVEITKNHIDNLIYALQDIRDRYMK